MRTYNYLSNELPRELIEVYNDLQSDVLRIIVKELKVETPPDKVFAKIQNKVSSYDNKTQEVLSVMFADSKKKAVKDGEKDFDEEDKEPVTNKEANSIIEPLVISSMLILSQLNKKIVNNALNDVDLSILRMIQLNPGLNAKQISEKLHLQYSRITLDVVKNSLKRKLVQYVEFRGSPKTGGYFVI